MEYEDWIALCYEVAREKGFRSSFEKNQDAVSRFAEIWRENTDLRTASSSAARRTAEEEIVIR